MVLILLLLSFLTARVQWWLYIKTTRAQRVYNMWFSVIYLYFAAATIENYGQPARYRYSAQTHSNQVELKPTACTCVCVCCLQNINRNVRRQWRVTISCLFYFPRHAMLWGVCVTPLYMWWRFWHTSSPPLSLSSPCIIFNYFYHTVTFCYCSLCVSTRRLRIDHDVQL